jgi:uncharacterized protein (TIGR02145 family)
MKKLFLTLILVLFVVPFGMSQDLPSYVPTVGLVAFYGFDGNVIDLTQNGYDGLVHNSQNGTINFSIDRKGISNSAIDFNSNPEWNYLGPYVEFQQTSNLCVDSDFSINFFLNLSSNNIRGDVINKGPDNLNGNLLSRVYDNNTLKNGVSQVEYLFTQSDYLEGWKMITITNFDGLWSIYVNGDLSSSGNIGNISNNDSPYFLGAMPSGGSNGSHWPLQGSVDDLGFWNRALTEQEIQNLYTSSSGDIILNGVVSAENNQIRNVADPTHTQDAVTLGLLLEKISSLQDQIDALQSTSGSGAVTDQDGNSYPYLTYGDQVWTVKNAEMVTYRDGTPIPQVTDATEWTNLTTGAWCYYDNDPSKGKLYNWYAVAGIHDNDENTPNKELAPEGWHVPSDAEWTELENYLIANGYNYDGTITGNKIAKAMSSTTGWNDSTTNGAPGNNQLNNNNSGFNAFPIGTRTDYSSFIYEGEVIDFWSSVVNDTDAVHNRFLKNSDNFLNRDIDGGNKQYGICVRFVKD